MTKKRISKDSALESGLAEDWIRQGLYPRLRGPSPYVTLALGLIGLNLVFYLAPEAGTVWGLSIFTAIMMAGLVGLGAFLRAPRADSLAGLALLVLPWGLSFLVADQFDRLHGIWVHGVLTMQAVTLFQAHANAVFRYAWRRIMDQLPCWGHEGLARYADFILRERPGFSPVPLAMDLYRATSEAIVAAQIRGKRTADIVARYADLILEKGRTEAECREAEYWMAQAADLEMPRRPV